MANKVDDMHKGIKRTANKVDDTANKVEETANKVDDIHKILFKLKRSGTMLGSDTLARQEMPMKPEIFHGRDELVDGIVQSLLQEKTSRMCILGPGGMGKTSVSLAVVESPLIKERFPGGNCIWVPCIEATSGTLLLEILYTQLQVPGDKQVTLEKIISDLDASKEPHLILLDNFETPWNAPGGTQKQVSDILRKLVMLSHVAILLTMRGTYPPCDAIEWQSHTIQPTDEAACRHIFHDINSSSKDDPDIDRLLAALGHMPFAVTLMANLGKRGKSTANELLETWYTSGTDMLSVTNSPEKNMNRSISLSVDSDFVKQDPDVLPFCFCSPFSIFIFVPILAFIAASRHNNTESSLVGNIRQDNSFCHRHFIGCRITGREEARKSPLSSPLRGSRLPVVYAAARPDRRGDPGAGTFVML